MTGRSGGARYVWTAAILLCLASRSVAQTTQVSGRLELHGPPRSLLDAQITLRYVGKPWMGSSSQEARRTQPGPDGRFAFTDVDPGIYVLQAEGLGILGAQWGSLGPELAGRALVVHGGDNLHDLVLPVTSRPMICGQVLGVDGKPAAHAGVSAWKPAADGGMMQGGGEPDGVMQGGQVETDAEGRYRLDRMVPGKYIVGASMQKPQAAAFWKDSLDSKSAVAIELRGEGQPDTCPYDLHLRQIPAPYSGPRYRLEGTISPEDAAKLAGKTLEWNLDAIDRPLRDFRGEWKAVPFNAANPGFDFGGIPPGKYRLTLGYSRSGGYSGGCYPFERDEVRLDIAVSEDQLDLRPQLRPTATIRGQVDEIHTPQDSRKLSAKQTYYVGLGQEVSPGEPGKCTAVNALGDGSFEIDDLDPGDYYVAATVPDRAIYTSAIELNGQQVTDGSLHLVAGENRVRIVKRFDAGEIDATVLPWGRVTPPQGDVPRGLLTGPEEVLLIDENNRVVTPYFGIGGYRMRGSLRPGRYTAVVGANEQLLWSWADKKWNDPHLLQAMTALGTSFTIQPGETAKVNLEDRTVEIQDLTAKLGMPMDRR